MRISSVVSTLAFFALIVTLGQGCGPFGQKFAEKAVERTIEQKIKTEEGKDVNVDINSGSVQMNDQEGRSFAAGENVSFPPSFPSSIPRYQNGKLVFVTADEQENSYGYTMTSSDKKEDIISWFKTSAEGNGYTRSAYIEAGSSVIMGYERKGADGTVGLNITVVDGDDGQTSFTVVSSVQ